MNKVFSNIIWIPVQRVIILNSNMKSEIILFLRIYFYTFESKYE